MKRPSQYQRRGTIRVLVFCLSLAVTGCGDDEAVEPEPQEKTPTVSRPVAREWYPTPKHTQQQPTMFPVQPPVTTQPDTMYQPAPQQPQVIIVNPAYQPRVAQPLQQQQAVPWQQPAYTQPAVPQQQYVPQYQPQQQYVPQYQPQQQYVPQYQPQQQYVPQYQYGQRPWGETGSYGQSRTAQPAGGGPQQTFSVPYGTPQAPAGGAYPGWGLSPPGTFPGNPYPGSVW